MNKPKNLDDDQKKHLRYLVKGMLYEYNEKVGLSLSQRAYHEYLMRTIELTTNYLEGKTKIDSKFSDFQCEVALEAGKLFKIE